MRNDELLYKDIHHKRLSYTIHEIIPIFDRFLQEISTIQLEMAQMTMNIDIAMADKEEPEDIDRVAWTSIGKWFRFIAEDEYNMVEVLLQENCVFKDKRPECIDIWIGYCICNLSCVKDVHREHLEGKHQLILKRMVGVIPETKEMEFDIDDLYN
jgi:hypothetical protein